MSDKLTAKQQRFIDEYLTCWNATEAARRAGYADPNRNASRLTVNNGIREEIERRMAEHAMPANEVLARLTMQARADLRDLFDFDDEGNVSGLKLTRDAPLFLIRSITPTRYGTKIETHDQQGALALLAKHHALLTEKIEHSGEVAIKAYVSISPDEWDEPDDSPAGDVSGTPMAN